MKCPNCKNDMQKTFFDIGYGIKVMSNSCKRCGFNVTGKSTLNKAIGVLRERMKKEVKVIRVGDGLGIRFPNEFIKSYEIRKGNKLLVQPEEKGIKVFFE